MLNEITFRLQIVLGYQKTDLVSFRAGYFFSKSSSMHPSSAFINRANKHECSLAKRLSKCCHIYQIFWTRRIFTNDKIFKDIIRAFRSMVCLTKRSVGPTSTIDSHPNYCTFYEIWPLPMVPFASTVSILFERRDSAMRWTCRNHFNYSLNGKHAPIISKLHETHPKISFVKLSFRPLPGQLSDSQNWPSYLTSIHRSWSEDWPVNHY